MGDYYENRDQAVKEAEERGVIVPEDASTEDIEALITAHEHGENVEGHADDGDAIVGDQGLDE
jgi:hypothetical protein